MPRISASSRIRVDQLLGRRVRDRDGRSVGRIEEIRTESRDGAEVVVEFITGSIGVAERLSARTVMYRLLSLFRLYRGRKGKRIPWDQVDLSDARHPTLTGLRGELADAG